jgi:Kef-type K+ transport system membrane component KefB
MLTYHFLLDLAIILLSTKILGVITRKVQMPQVVGALMAGLVLGPAVFGIIHETQFIKQLAEIGVIVIMFIAGLDTDIKELKKCGKASFIVALFGVILPLAGGFVAASLFNNGTLLGLNRHDLLENIFIGIILTATSVSITVETLQEMGKLKTRTGTIILGAALIDDILGIIILTFVSSTTGTSTSLLWVILMIVAFFIFSAVIGIPFHNFFDRYSERYGEKRRFPIIALSFCLVMSFIAEHFFGVADIAGAFIAGLVFSGTRHCSYIKKRTGTVSYMLLSPIFFASIGISIHIDMLYPRLIIFSIVLLAVAVLTKILGCSFGSFICGLKNKEALQIGTGMVARSEVALIVANKGVALGLLGTLFFTPVIVMVIVTAILTPVLLKLVYKGTSDIVCVE